MEAKCEAGQVRPLGLWSGSGMADCISDIRQNDTGCEVHREEKEASNGLKTHLNLGCKKDILGNSNSITVDNMPSSDVGNSIVSADMKIHAELEKEQFTVDDAEETNISVNTPNSLCSELHSSKADDDVDKGKADSLKSSSSPTSKSVLPDHVEECVSAAASNLSSIPECSDLPQSSSHCSPSGNTQQPSSPVTINQSGIQSDTDRDNSSPLKPVSSTDLLPNDLDVNHSSDIPGESEVKENQSEILCKVNISSPNHGASENDNELKDDGHQVEAVQETSNVQITPIDNNIEEDAKMDVESQDMTEAEKTVEKMPQSEECETNSPLEKIVSDQHDDGCIDEFSIKEGNLDNHDISSCNERNEAADTNLDVNMTDAETEVGNANSQDSISGEGNDGESQVNLEEEADNAEMEFCDIKIAESISMAVDDSGEMTEDIVMCDDETDKSNKDTDNTETATNSNENNSCASSAKIQIEKTEGNTVDAVMTDNEEHSNDKTCNQNSAPAESEEDKNNVTDSVSPCDEVKSHTPSPQSARENDAFCPEITNVESHEDKTFDCTSLDADKIVENHEVEETGQLEKCSQGEDGDKCSTSDLSLQHDKNISDEAQKVLTENDNLHAPDTVQSEVSGKPSSPIIKDEADIKTKVHSPSESSIIHKDTGKDVKSEGTEEKSSDPQEDMKTGVSEGDEGADVDKNLEETKDEKKIRLNSQVDNESLDDKIVIDMKEDNDEDLDDEILFIDDDGKSKPLSEAPKLSFKNILKAPSISPKVQNNVGDAKCTAEENKKKMTSESSHSTVGMKTITTLTHTKLIPDTRASLDSRDNAHEHKPGASTSKTQEEVILENERKRSLSDKDDAPTTEAKRTKLDAMIDKLGDHLGKKPSEAAMEVLDSDDEAVLLDEQPNETIKDTQSTEEECKDKTAGKSEDDSSQKESKDEKPLQLTSQVLQSLIVAHIKAFAKKQRQSNIDKLNRRTRSMQSATNLWKDTAKHLEKTVLELTVLNQKLEKRKAHSNAVKQLASRTIGVQVGNDLKSSRSGSATTNGPTNKKPEAPLNSSASLSLPPSVLLNPPPSQPQQPQQNPRFMQQPTNRPAAPSPAQPHIHGPQIRAGRPPLRMQANNNVSPSQAVRQPGFANGRMVQQTNARIPTPSAPPKTVVNLIDLTDEEDIVKRTAPQAPRPAVTQPVSQHISKLGPAWKMSSSPSSGPTSQAQVPTASPGVVMGPNSQLIQTPASGGQTQIITQGNPPIGVPISQYQFVNIGNTAAQRPGTYLALVPGARTPTASVAINPSQANMGASSQNSTPQSSTAAAKTTSYSLPPSFHISSKHPAPLPSGSDMGNAPPSAKKRPPKPGLKISRVSQGIVLSWNMPFLGDSEKISSYQLFAYQETETSIPKSNLWKKVGDVKALPLPMACTLTQFQEGNKYHFAVRAVDHYGRSGPYSDPSSIFLGPKT